MIDGMAGTRRTPRLNRAQIRRNRVKLGAVGGVLASLALAAGMVTGSTTRVSPAYDEAAEVAAVPPGLTAHQLAGQRFVAGFSGTRIPMQVKKAIRSGRLGGIILFADNLPSRATARRITRQLQDIRRPRGLARYPLPVMIDQEGGLVKRLPGAPNVSAEQMGRRGASFSRTQGKRTARNLRNAGVNVDLAPVLDVARPGGEIADTDRGFGRTAKRVSATAIPFARGLQANGVAATAKHFPGLGAVRLNTDDAVQRIDLSRSTLRKVDEAPYRPFIRAGGGLVMVGTAIYPAFSERPAAFEKRIATRELRNRLGFEGVTITDSLEAVAARSFGRSPRLSLAAARAGMDILLFNTWREALKGEDALAKRLKGGKLDRRQFEDSVARILTLRRGFPR
jgi:beta-N-acetylhexosaminidase